MPRLFYGNYASQGNPYWYNNNYGYGYGTRINIVPATETQGYVYLGVSVVAFIIFIGLIVFLYQRSSNSTNETNE